MIYGINFNNTAIPDAIRRKFPVRIRIQKRIPKVQPAIYAELKGVGQSPEERDIMLTVANNGHRQLHVEKRMTVAGPWYGIYVY